LLYEAAKKPAAVYQTAADGPASRPAGVATRLQAGSTLVASWHTIAPHPLPGWRNW